MTTGMRLVTKGPTAALCIVWSIATGFAPSSVAAVTSAVVPWNMLVVSSTADTESGDNSSPQALTAHPGPDGITLRGALAAADAAPGSQTIFITFAPRLAGQRITPTLDLPPVTRAHVTIVGILGPDGRPAVTLSGALLPFGQARGPVLLDLDASHVAVRGLQFSDVRQGAVAVHIPGGAGARQADDVWVDQNAFLNDAVNVTATAVVIGPDLGTSSTVVANVTVSRNTFRHYLGDGDGVKLQGIGTGTLVQGVTVTDNSFSQMTYPVELVDGFGSGNRIVGSRIVGNDFMTGSHQAISIGSDGTDADPSSADLIDNTLIAANRCTVEDTCIAISSVYDGASVGSGNTVRNTAIVNNLMTGPGGGIALEGGDGLPANRVDAVQIASNTVVGPRPLTMFISLGRTREGIVSGVAATNDIFAATGGRSDFQGDLVPESVHSSITRSARFSGVNGNIAADPLFVNAAGGDYHLRAGSPAVGAGTSAGSPATDIAGSPRSATRVDMGAYAFAGQPLSLLTVALNEAGGAGTVTSTPAGIDCAATCTATLAQHASVWLAAAPDPFSRFTGWSGACSGMSACSVRMGAARLVTAAFEPAARKLSVTMTGKGQVTSTPAGIACTASCVVPFAAGTTLELHAGPSTGYRFTGWSGACHGTGACQFQIAGDSTVQAGFSTTGSTLSLPLMAGGAAAIAMVLATIWLAYRRRGRNVRRAARP